METGITYCKLDKELIYTRLYHEAQGGSYTSYLRGKRCSNDQAFFYEVSASFQFPWYFGENWAAFDECICDLEWLSFHRIFIVIDDFSSMFKGNKVKQRKLIGYLTSMVNFWKENNITVEIILNS